MKENATRASSFEDVLPGRIVENKKKKKKKEYLHQLHLEIYGGLVGDLSL
jgi:hypothetical protein